MKYNSEEILQFSGYPLKIVDDKLSGNGKPGLFVIRTEKQQIPGSLFYTLKVINEPENWDAEWFGNYE
jgi:hypothetical protein